ncbi:phage P2 GpU family protein [Enterobacter cloacae]|uniref:Phage P2 GpU family protein n=6 Tax=Enterobacteriaceae TaxID=543 RepID=A0A377LS59_ENTCL|nr:phage P2 GpU family protein [Enterobacter cloacae]
MLSQGKVRRILPVKLPDSLTNASARPGLKHAAISVIKGDMNHDDGTGLYVFMLRTVPYQELQYQRSWRHAANSRVNRRPSTQFLGPDNDSLTLSGVLLPEVTGGRLSLLALEQMAELGKAWPLIEGSGTIYGMFVIESLSQTKTEFFESGMPRRIEFTLTLKRVDESLSDMFGSLSDQLSNLQDSATSAIGNIKNTVGGLLQ